jgi:SAM-dependent MidA family methyltransferase
MPHDEVVYNEELDAYVCNECIRESTEEVSQVKLTPNEISFTVDSAQINTEFLERVLGVNIEEQYRAVEDEIRNRIQDDINQHMERNMLPF